MAAPALVLAKAGAASNPSNTSVLNARPTDAFAPQELCQCIQDTGMDWNTTFSFSFLVQYIKKGDLPQRVCTAAELNLYFESILDTSSKKNCNLMSRVDNFEPGWGWHR